MKTIKPQKLGLLTRSYEHYQKFHLGISILAFIPLQPEPALIPEVDMWKFAASELGKDALLDAGIPKARPEFLVTGSCYTPNGEQRGACPVRVRLGAVEKTLYIYGDRYFRDGVPTEAAPFVTMPLSWNRAFGGEGFDRNPMGRGFGPTEANGVIRHWLPNIHNPAALMTAPDQRPEPAGLGPVEFTWPQRFSKAGTHNDLWLKEDFPGFARDIDWTMFNTASPDQWLNGSLRGDEAYLLENMHPSDTVIEGRLPSIVARCYINRRVNETGRFEEVTTQLTTVWFFPHRKRALLIFHGSIQVQEDDGADILHIIVAAENMAEPRGQEYYWNLLNQRLDKDKGHLLALRDHDLLPANLADVPLSEVPMATAEGLLRKNLRNKAETRITEARSLVAAYGLDPDMHGPPLLPAETAPPDLDNLEKFIEDANKKAEEQKQKTEAEKIERDKAVKKLFGDLGLDFAILQAEMETAHSGPPVLPGQKDRKTLGDLAEKFRSLGLPTEEMDEMLANPEREKLRVFADEQCKAAYRTSAHYQPPAQKMASEETDRVRKTVTEAHNKGESLANTDLTGADLSGLDLQGVNFEGAFLERVNFDGANLTGANLRNAVLAHASLRSATLTEATLSGANLGTADLCEMMALRADFTNAILGKANFAGADFSDSNLEGANVSEALFERTNFSGVKAQQLLFYKSNLQGLVFSGASLPKCSFLDVSMMGCDLSGALLESAVFFAVKGKGALFKEAKMTNARFVQGCSFEGADFSKATLTRSNLRSSQLRGCNFAEAGLDHADLSESDLRETNFHRAQAKEARFVRCDLRRATLASINAMNAVFQKADIRGADFRGANLFQADLARVHADTATDLSDALTTKARVYPRRTASSYTEAS